MYWGYVCVRERGCISDMMYVVFTMYRRYVHDVLGACVRHTHTGYSPVARALIGRPNRFCACASMCVLMLVERPAQLGT